MPTRLIIGPFARGRLSALASGMTRLIGVARVLRAVTRQISLSSKPDAVKAKGAERAQLVVEIHIGG